MGGATQPNTHSQGNTAQAKTQCPLAEAKPCAVDALSITVQAYDDDSKGETAKTGARKKIPMYLTTTKPLRGHPVKDAKGREVREDFLGTYDLVFETIADYNSSETPKGLGDPEDCVTLDKVHASFTTPDCPRDEHALLKIVAKTAAPELPKKAIILQRQGVANLIHAEDKRFLAPNLAFDAGSVGTGPFVVFEWILSLWLATKPKEIEIYALGCGKREKGDARSANHDLRALLRIHRRDKWTIAVKIPALGSYKNAGKPDGSRESTLAYGVPGARTEVKREVNRNAGGLQTNSVGTRDLVERQVTMSQHRAGNYQGVERINRFGDADRGRRLNYKTVNERLSKAHGFDVAIARNDREIGLEDLIDKSKSIGQGAAAAYQNRGLALQQLKQSVQNFAAAISTIQDLFKKLPKAGWYFEFGLSVFAGSVVFEWAPAYQQGPLGGRYYPVGTEFKFKIAMEILNLSLTLGFGIQCYAAGTGFRATIDGTVKFKIAIEKEFAGDDEQRRKLEVIGVCDGALTPQLHVSVLGWTVAEAKASLSSGLEYKGYFVIDKKANQFGLKGVVKSKPVVLTASFYAGWWSGTKQMDPYTILQGATIYTFK
ncbi:MAG: hypothetical protein HOW73_06000 [Polyangiaceae bacterium]|nr:hypothetical protein [Polyangiaceae bacterium]